MHLARGRGWRVKVNRFRIVRREKSSTHRRKYDADSYYRTRSFCNRLMVFTYEQCRLFLSSVCWIFAKQSSWSLSVKILLGNLCGEENCENRYIKREVIFQEGFFIVSLGVNLLQRTWSIYHRSSRKRKLIKLFLKAEGYS